MSSCTSIHGLLRMAINLHHSIVLFDCGYKVRRHQEAEQEAKQFFETMFIGVIIDNKLSWEPHYIRTLNKKLNYYYYYY